jgi:hypothetical protein
VPLTSTYIEKKRDCSHVVEYLSGRRENRPTQALLPCPLLYSTT